MSLVSPPCPAHRLACTPTSGHLVIRWKRQTPANRPGAEHDRPILAARRPFPLPEEIGRVAARKSGRDGADPPESIR
jgi:hypothetical protein